jgi:predicted DNA binding protein
MAVSVELEAPAERFALGRATDQTEPSVRHVAAERVVPLGNGSFPTVRAVTDDPDGFERAVASHESADLFELVEERDGTAVYRARWVEAPDDLTVVVRETGGVALAVARREGHPRWVWDLRFPTRESITAFRDACTDRDVDVRVRRIGTDGAYGVDPTQDLTAEQRAALELAYDRGYFEVPRRTTLSDVAAELNISQQAASELVRRALDSVVGRVLRGESDG